MAFVNLTLACEWQMMEADIFYKKLLGNIEWKKWPSHDVWQNSSRLNKRGCMGNILLNTPIPKKSPNRLLPWTMSLKSFELSVEKHYREKTYNSLPSKSLSIDGAEGMGWHSTEKKVVWKRMVSMCIQWVGAMLFGNLLIKRIKGNCGKKKLGKSYLSMGSTWMAGLCQTLWASSPSSNTPKSTQRGQFWPFGRFVEIFDFLSCLGSLIYYFYSEIIIK